jgi:hypothetical protein
VAAVRVEVPAAAAPTRTATPLAGVAGTATTGATAVVTGMAPAAAGGAGAAPAASPIPLWTSTLERAVHSTPADPVTPPRALKRGPKGKGVDPAPAAAPSCGVGAGMDGHDRAPAPQVDSTGGCAINVLSANIGGGGVQGWRENGATIVGLAVEVQAHVVVVCETHLREGEAATVPVAEDHPWCHATVIRSNRPGRDPSRRWGGVAVAAVVGPGQKVQSMKLLEECPRGGCPVGAIDCGWRKRGRGGWRGIPAAVRPDSAYR